MYCTRPATRSPSVIRVINPCARRAPSTSRNASFFPSFASAPQIYATPFFRQQTQDPFRGLDRLLEDIASPSFPFGSPQQTQARPSAPTFQPRFDVREVENGYELRGEIPGVESKDLEVEFSDAHTLIVRGRSEREASSPDASEAVQSAKGKAPVTNEAAVASEAADAAAEQAADDSDAASTYSTGSYQKPSVEDSEAGEANEAKATPATTPGEQATEQATEQQVAAPIEQQQQTSRHRYFISERSTGSFQRVFKFQDRVEQTGVRASLKNGILDIHVPKAPKPEPRRIVVE